MDLEAAARLVTTELSARGRAEDVASMQKYMKTEMPFHGVMSRGQGEVFRLLRKDHSPSSMDEYRALVLELWELPRREEKHMAISVAEGFRRFISPECLPLYARLVREGAWWDFVDRVAIHCVGVALRSSRRVVGGTMKGWIEDECMWMRRSAILCQVGHRQDTDEEMLFDFCLRRCGEKEFFIRKAIGWALREYSYTSPDGVARFLVENRVSLSGLSFREGAKALVRSGWTPPAPN
jgi:3-methyladenine DNA glycosylase AlkD